MPIEILKKKFHPVKVKFKQDSMNWKDLNRRMRKLKESLEIFNVNLTSIKCKSKNYFLIFRMREEKLLLISKVWVEKFVVLKKRRKNFKLVFKVRLKGVKTTKQCSEKLTNKGKNKEEKLWWVKNKLWENFRHWQEKESNSSVSYKITNNKKRKMKTILKEWNTKLLKSREN